MERDLGVFWGLLTAISWSWENPSFIEFWDPGSCPKTQSSQRRGRASKDLQQRPVLCWITQKLPASPLLSPKVGVQGSFRAVWSGDLQKTKDSSLTLLAPTTATDPGAGLGPWKEDNDSPSRAMGQSQPHGGCPLLLLQKTGRLGPKKSLHSLKASAGAELTSALPSLSACTSAERT